MGNLLKILLGLALLGLPAAACAETSRDVLQLGAGYQMQIACDGTKLRVERLADGEVRVACSASVKREVPPAGGELEQLRLAPGDSRHLFCQGLRLVAKRESGAQMRARCRAAATPAI